VRVRGSKRVSDGASGRETTRQAKGEPVARGKAKSRPEEDEDRWPLASKDLKTRQAVFRRRRRCDAAEGV
jgi:hypothetical protein